MPHHVKLLNGPLAELADAGDLRSFTERCPGSSPGGATKNSQLVRKKGRTAEVLDRHC